MTVQVSLFARARELAGVSAVAVRVAPGSRVKDLRRGIGTQYPALASLLPACAIAIGHDFAADSDLVPEGNPVALLPPVSGG